MNWKNLANWKKGFFIAIVLHVMYLMILFPLMASGIGGQGEGNIFAWVFIFTDLIIVNLFLPFIGSFIIDSPSGIIIAGILATFICGLIGALIGLIIDKRKLK